MENFNHQHQSPQRILDALLQGRRNQMPEETLEPPAPAGCAESFFGSTDTSCLT